MQPQRSTSEELAAALADGSALLGASSPANVANNMETVLKNRLLAYYVPSQVPQRLTGILNLEELQLLTAREAIVVLKRVQKVLDSETMPENEIPTSQAPSIGTRDLAQLRTMLSLAFKWEAEPLLTRIIQAWPIATPHGPKIIDLTLDFEDYKHLSDLLLSIFSLIFPEGSKGRISQTLITTTILTRHVTDLLLPSISLGWLPDSFSSSSMPTLHEARPLVTRILRLLTPAQAIIALGGILSTLPPPPIHTRKICTFLLTKQLLRPEGVPGLCEAMFSAEETSSDDAKIEKLEQIAKTLNTVPANMKAQEYYPLIFPRVLKLLTNDIRTSYRRATAFTIYRAIVPQKSGQNQEYASSVVLDMLHRPLLETMDSPDQQKPQDPVLAPHEALAALTILLSNTEPSPTFIPKILSPILPVLYQLSFDLDQIKTTDPQLKGSVNGLLVSWGKIIDEVEGSKILWSIVEGGKEGDWKFNLEGHFWKTKTSEKRTNPSLLLPGEQQQESEDDDFNANLNLFDLYPDPIHFVQLLKQIDRGDISSNLFLKLLENYRDMKGRSGEDSMMILHKLQIIMQMQNRLSEGTTSNILRKPNHLLTFIFHVLDSANMTIQHDLTSNNGAATSTSGEDMFDEGDSDDEAPDSEPIGPDDELIETAITLLLSILEADEGLTARTHPIFNDIFTKLELLALKGSSTLRPLAREARLVITARLADSSEFNRSKNAKRGEDVQEIYQKALKLLQDPILPVRAHGLLLLRQLVSPEFAKDQQMNTALLPAILSIFLQSVQDEDSYIFLNAVQGLASLVDSYGKEILQRLMHDYTDGLDGLGAGNLTQQDVDVRTRIGEALSSVIKRCGSTLGLYVDMLVPPLFAVVRASNVPTTLRTSSLSLLAECVDTYPLAMLPYIEDLCQALVHLLQVESLPFQERISKSKFTGTEGQQENDTEKKSVPPTMDSDPTSRNSKFPPLRRAALHFLSLLIRATTKIVYDDTRTSAATSFSKENFRGLSLTLGYVSSTDEDDVVRVMAREAKENLEQLQRAAFGL